MQKRLGALALSILVLFAGAYAYERGVARSGATELASNRREITVAGERLVVDLATTDAEREKGLSGRESLGADEGMLFVFPQDGVHRFWMKGMNFPLDIIWLSSDGRIVYIAPSLSPSTYPNSYGPTFPTRFVLEVNAGFAVEKNLHIGDRVTL